jgi:hypothetical protein
MPVVPYLPDPVDYAIPGFVVLVLAEMLVARLRDRRRFCPKDTLTSLSLGLGSTVAGLLSAGLVYALAMWVYQFRIFTIGFAWYWFVLAFVLDDFAYYVFHRAAHRIRWFWASHVIHHSSQHYNLRRGAEPDLPVLDPHRGDRPHAALVRGGDEHAVAPPRPPRDQPALSRQELCRGLHRLGPHARHL